VPERLEETRRTLRRLRAILVDLEHLAGSPAEHADPQLAGLPTHLLAIGPRRRRRRVGITRHRPGDRVEDRRRVADGAREDTFPHQPAERVAEIGTERGPPARWLQPDEPARAGRDADR